MSCDQTWCLGPVRTGQDMGNLVASGGLTEAQSPCLNYQPRLIQCVYLFIISSAQEGLKPPECLWVKWAAFSG
jgi:hypothetical protein